MAKFLQTQTLETLHLTNRSEQLHCFTNQVLGDQAGKIKDSSMALLLKSLTMSATQGLKHLRLEHMRLNTDANAEALGQLICGKASYLESLYFEGMFGKKKLVEQAFVHLGGMLSKESLRELFLRQGDMTDKQIYLVASAVQRNFPALRTLVCEGAYEI